MDGTRREPYQLLRVGDKAPGFSLKDHDGNAVTLMEFSGKKNVVLVFYPRDNTPGCTKQLCAIRDQFALFVDSETVVYGINPQGSGSHSDFVDKHGFPFPLLVDHEKKAVSDYGCKGTLMTKRTVYGIDKEGMIVFARRGAPSNEEILRAFRK